MKDISSWLSDLHSDQSQKRIAAITSIAQQESPPKRYLAYIEATLWDKYASVCRAALDTLGHLCEYHGFTLSPKALKRVYELTDAQDAKLRADATASLALVLPIQSRETRIKVLTKQLEDESPIVRQSAASALGDLSAQEAITVLKKFLGDTDQETRFECAYALSRMPVKALGTDTILLRKVLQAAISQPDKRMLCAEALANIADSSSLDLLRKVSKQVFISWSDRLSIFGAMYHLGDEEAGQKLLARISAWSKAERIYAISLAGRYKLYAAATKIRAIASDGRKLEKIAAIKALGDMQEQQHIELLLTLLAKPQNDEDVHEAARAAIQQIKDALEA